MKPARDKPNGSPHLAKRKPRGGRVKVADKAVFARSRITNGKEFLPFVDGRSVWARTVKATYDSIVEHCGGPDAMTVTKDFQARRCAYLDTELTFMEAKTGLIRERGGEPTVADIDAYALLAATYVAWLNLSAGNAPRVT